MHNLAEESGLKNISAIVQNLHQLGLLRIEEKNKKQLAVRSEKNVSLVDDKIARNKTYRPDRSLVVGYLQKHGSMSIGNLIKKANTSSAVVNNLYLKGIIKFTASEVIRRDPFSQQSAGKKRRSLSTVRKNWLSEEISQNLGKKYFYAGFTSRHHRQRKNGGLFKRY